MNTDGSSHVEEIIEWQPDRRLRIRMQDFSAPLSRLATHFEETWEFQSVGDKTQVTRLFQMHAKSALTRPFLWVISLFLKRAIARNLRQMAAASGFAAGVMSTACRSASAKHPPADAGGRRGYTCCFAVFA
jgi:hypothetical protein